MKNRIARVHAERACARVSAAAGPRAALLLAASLAPAVAAQAQAPQYGEAPASDLTGRWTPVTCLPDGATCPFDVETLPLTRAGRNLTAAFEEQLGPKFDCVQATVPSLLADPYRFAIHQLADRVIFEYEKDDIVRTVYLEGWGHPEPGPYDASWQGHSRGRYEGDTLVVVTDRFLYDPTGLEDLGGIPSSTLKRVTERYTREDDRLVAEVVTQDPLILEEPVAFTFVWEHGEEPLILPYACELDQARQAVQFADPESVPNLRSSGQSEPTRGGVPVGGNSEER